MFSKVEEETEAAEETEEEEEHKGGKDACSRTHGKKERERERETGGRTSLHSMFQEEEETLVARMRDGTWSKRRGAAGTIQECDPRQAPETRSTICTAGDENCTYGQAGEEKDINGRV
jgi:hypothetical protein